MVQASTEPTGLLEFYFIKTYFDKNFFYSEVVAAKILVK